MQRSLLPDAILCGATVSACASAGQWQHAFQLLLEVEVSLGRVCRGTYGNLKPKIGMGLIGPPPKIRT